MRDLVGSGPDLIDRMRSNVKNIRITAVQAEIRTWNTPGIQVYSVSAANVKLKVKCLSKFEVLTAIAMRIQIFAVSYPHKTCVLDIYKCILVMSSVGTSF
jgi:hypothetical protein